MTPFWYHWKSSWLVELSGGFMLGSILQWPISSQAPLAATIIGTLIMALVLSATYDFSPLDPNDGLSTHHPWMDIGQRLVGVALGVVFWRLG